MRNRSIKEAERHNKKKLQSPFVNYCVTAVSVILIVSVTLVLAVFKTDALIDVNIEFSTKTTYNARMSATTTKELTEALINSEPAIGGIENTLPGVNGDGNPEAVPVPGVSVLDNITDEAILDDIAKGLYTQEDYNYLVACGQESTSYEGFYAVACCIRNRVNHNNSSYKAEITKKGQFQGYNENELGKPKNDDVKRAAIAVLRGGASSIGDSYFFFGRSNGYSIWAEPDCLEFYNVGGNVYYTRWGDVHNEVPNMTPGAIVIYDHITGTWNYKSGEGYKQQ